MEIRSFQQWLFDPPPPKTWQDAVRQCVEDCDLGIPDDVDGHPVSVSLYPPRPEYPDLYPIVFRYFIDRVGAAGLPSADVYMAIALVHLPDPVPEDAGEIDLFDRVSPEVTAALSDWRKADFSYKSKQYPRMEWERRLVYEFLADSQSAPSSVSGVAT